MLEVRRKRDLVGALHGRDLLVVFFLLLAAPPSLADESFFSNMFSPDSLMGAGPAARGTPPATPPGFSDQSAYVGLSGSGAVAAVGDFNRDRFVDLVMLNARTLRDVSIMFWDHDAFSFKHRGAGVSLARLDVLEKGKETPMKSIAGVHVGDFGNDGTLGLLLHDGERGRIFFGDGEGNFNETNAVVVPELPREHAIMDANADLVPDLFVAFRNGTRGFWVFVPDAAAKDDNEEATTSAELNAQKGAMMFQEWNGAHSKGDDGKDCVVLDPVSISFVDMDGDCLADLVIPTSCGLEVWSNPADSNKKFWELEAGGSSSESDMRLLGLEVFNNAHGDQSVAFADFNSDGTMDIAVPNRNRQDLVVHLNRQKKRDISALCERDPDWDLDERTGLSTGLNMRSRNIGRLFNTIEVPSSLHVGDFDLDGLPDIMTIDGSSTRPVVFKNDGNWDEKHMRDSHFTRVKRKEEQGLSNGNSGSVTGMFFDTDEGGRQDLLIVRNDNETRLIWNNMQDQTDSLFFKGTILSALPYRQEPRPFAPVVGNTLKLSYMERGSRERVTRVCSQCGQSGLWQLRACNCQFGLMQIANYIEELWVGGGAGRRSWANLMPNSMAVVWAESERDGTTGDASAWWMEYFTQRRGSQMLRVTAILILALAALGVAILSLQHQERKQDREEDELERARLFNFV